MALEQKLNLKLAQRLVMTPSLQQAIKLLQLSRLELGETLNQEILENPMLDVDGQQEDAASLEKESGDTATSGEGQVTDTPGKNESEESKTAEEAYAEIDVEAFFADYLADSRPEGPSMAFRDPELSSSIENTLSESPGLYEHLRWQLNLIGCPNELLPTCEFILGNLDEDGFLQATDDEICEGTGASMEQVARALAVIRGMDPPGIGSRTLQECLLIQVEVLLKEGINDGEEQESFEKARMVLRESWDDLLHQRWQKVADRLDCKVVEIKPILNAIHRLETKPGRLFQVERNAYIEPDVYVKDVDGEYVIQLNDDGLPKLRINSRYSRMLDRGGAEPGVSSYLRERMRSAMWLIKSIDQRQRTIYKVAQSIVSFQKGFLDHGIEHLKPMILRQVAEDIGMHESTISRVVSNKYMYTPRGLFPMKFFFHSGVDSARGGNVSSLVVKDRIRKLVESEDGQRPLSDSKIMKILQREGVRLARRTVAKYREELSIPSSDKRKKVF